MAKSFFKVFGGIIGTTTTPTTGPLTSLISPRASAKWASTPFGFPPPSKTKTPPVPSATRPSIITISATNSRAATSRLASEQRTNTSAPSPSSTPTASKSFRMSSSTTWTARAATTAPAAKILPRLRTNGRISATRVSPRRARLRIFPTTAIAAAASRRTGKTSIPTPTTTPRPATSRRASLAPTFATTARPAASAATWLTTPPRK